MKRVLVTLGIGLFSLFVLVGSSGIDTSGAAEWDAEIRASNIRIKTPMKAGTRYDVEVKVKNIGTATWSRSDRIRLTSRIYRGPSGAPTQRDELTPDAEVGDDIAPNTTVDVEYRVEAPDYVGSYTIEWTMMKGSTKFGDRVQKTIKVVE